MSKAQRPARTATPQSTVNLQTPEEKKRFRNLLVLCVDRDDDIGVKAKVNTPIVGRQKCLDAAQILAISDPEEADANAIFAAVKELDTLRSEGYTVEVGLVSGNAKRGMDADSRIVSQVMQLVAVAQYDGVVLVSDGVDDERVIPLIQNTLPVISVKRVVIRHSARVEESYAVLSRYIRMVVYESRYSRFFLGVPGALIFAFGALLLLNLFQQAFAVLLIILGGSLIVRGFDLDRFATSVSKVGPVMYIRLFTGVASVMIIGVALLGGSTAVSQSLEYSMVVADPGSTLTYAPFLFGLIIQESASLLWIAVGVYLGGVLLTQFLRRSRRLWRNLLGIVILVFMYPPVVQLGQILVGRGSTFTFVSLILMGLSMTSLAAAFVYQYLRTRHQVKP
jgi:putative membrane protein